MAQMVGSRDAVWDRHRRYDFAAEPFQVLGDDYPSDLFVSDLYEACSGGAACRALIRRRLFLGWLSEPS